MAQEALHRTCLLYRARTSSHAWRRRLPPVAAKWNMRKQMRRFEVARIGPNSTPSYWGMGADGHTGVADADNPGAFQAWFPKRIAVWKMIKSTPVGSSTQCGSRLQTSNNFYPCRPSITPRIFGSWSRVRKQKTFLQSVEGLSLDSFRASLVHHAR